jgi:hypothetical protein
MLDQAQRRHTRGKRQIFSTFVANMPKNIHLMFIGEIFAMLALNVLIFLRHNECESTIHY